MKTQCFFIYQVVFFIYGTLCQRRVSFFAPNDTHSGSHSRPGTDSERGEHQGVMGPRCVLLCHMFGCQVHQVYQVFWRSTAMAENVHAPDEGHWIWALYQTQHAGYFCGTLHSCSEVHIISKDVKDIYDKNNHLKHE